MVERFKAKALSYIVFFIAPKVIAVGDLVQRIGISKQDRSAGVYPPLMPTMKVGAINKRV